jgi:amidase
MRTFLLLTFISFVALGQTVESPASGDWIFRLEQQGDRLMATRGQLNVSAAGEVSGKAGNFTIRGSLKGSAIAMEWLDQKGSVAAALAGKYESGRLAGTATSPDGLPYTWAAERDAKLPAQPRTHDFTPTEFQKYFSGAKAPVLHINPGDTVRTWSLDAGGADAYGKRKALGGNPLTGPFYVNGALPGDTLVVRLLRIRTNRDSAQSGIEIVSNAATPEYKASLKRAQGFSGQWRLDVQKGTVSLSNPSEALKNFRVPIEPMLGGIGVAPPRLNVVDTRDSGSFGGNMDYNRIREGTAVYLPIFHPGALLLVGDGHAAQGDGELTGDALETTMEIEFTVDVIREWSIGMPYAEDRENLMIIGIGGSLDEALRRATTGMARYLEVEHGLNSNEAAVVLGFALKYDIADLVGTQVSIVAKLPLATLSQLPPRKTH